jgi:hypothetical protein
VLRDRHLPGIDLVGAVLVAVRHQTGLDSSSGGAADAGATVASERTTCDKEGIDLPVAKLMSRIDSSASQTQRVMKSRLSSLVL